MSALDDIVDEIESRPGARRRIGAEVNRMNEVLRLGRLRHERQLTQADLGATLGMSQRRVSSIERSGEELQLDTLRRYVEGLGGELEITAVIDGRPITLLP